MGRVISNLIERKSVEQFMSEQPGLGPGKVQFWINPPYSRVEIIFQPKGMESYESHFHCKLLVLFDAIPMLTRGCSHVRDSQDVRLERN
jgi:hypothetical protein